MRAIRNKIGKMTMSVILGAVLSFSIALNAVATNETRLIPLGSTVGISLSSEGVIVVGIPEKMKDGEGESPAKGAGIKAGDIIKRIGTKEITTKEDLKDAVAKLDGAPVCIEALRGSQELSFTVKPYPSEDGKYELGLWLRDGVAGIGTMTFYDPETGLYGALGHSINDAEAGVQLPLRDGVIARSSVTNVAAGKSGAPGQLHGSFDFEDVLGSVNLNTGCGIFGYLKNTDITENHEALPVASANEIRTGPATILANISGSEVKEYKVEISRIYTGAEAEGRSMMITVTDPKLIEKTGGIVQGMSGSPIIQDGKLVGAVTHVLINDPERGYGISAEKMLQTATKGVTNKAA